MNPHFQALAAALALKLKDLDVSPVDGFEEIRQRLLDAGEPDPVTVVLNMAINSYRAQCDPEPLKALPTPPAPPPTPFVRTPREWRTQQALYRFFDGNGDLLYVGITQELTQRIATHDRRKPWWTDVKTMTVEWFDDREAVAQAERKAIYFEAPKHNIQKASLRRIVALERAN